MKKVCPKLKEYLIYENTIDAPSPIDRMRLIFERNLLIAIVHSRTLKIQGLGDFGLGQAVQVNKLLIFNCSKGVGQRKLIADNVKSYLGQISVADNQKVRDY